MYSAIRDTSGSARILEIYYVVIKLQFHTISQDNEETLLHSECCTGASQAWDYEVPVHHSDIIMIIVNNPPGTCSRD